MALQDFNCVLCNAAVEESLSHLFLECPFATQCWGLINIQTNQHSDPFQNLQSFRDQLRVPFFMEVIILMAWTIWRSRNGLIFWQVNPSILLALQNFKVELQLLLLRAKRSYSQASINGLQISTCLVACSAYTAFLSFLFCILIAPSCCFSLYSLLLCICTVLVLYQ